MPSASRTSLRIKSCLSAIYIPTPPRACLLYTYYTTSCLSAIYILHHLVLVCYIHTYTTSCLSAIYIPTPPRACLLYTYLHHLVLVCYIHTTPPRACLLYTYLHHLVFVCYIHTYTTSCLSAIYIPTPPRACLLYTYYTTSCLSAIYIPTPPPFPLFLLLPIKVNSGISNTRKLSVSCVCVSLSVKMSVFFLSVKNSVINSK